MKQLPQYQCHKVVGALKIKGIGKDDGLLHFEEAGYEPVALDPALTKRHVPLPGDYYVVYEDGYASLSPAKAFEAGYAPLKTDASRARIGSEGPGAGGAAGQPGKPGH